LLVITLLLGTGPAATALLIVVGLLFVLGVTRGVQGTLQGLAFKAWIRPRLAPPTELEDPRPPRFAQLVGLLVVGAGLLFAALGFPAGVPIAAAVALVAAFLNSAFGLCLGCELYLLGRRLAPHN
jgi:cytochrome c biogenesis protein CcdA